MNFLTPTWDLSLFLFINQTGSNALCDLIMPLISSPVFLWAVVLGGLALGARRHGKAQIVGLLLLALAVGAADGGTNLVKDAVGRVRPLNALAETRYVEDGQWLQRPADFAPVKERGNSYPSAHAANAMAAAFMIWLLWPGTRRFIWWLPLLVGLSRVYLGKHYPTDVAMGWVFGIAAALTVWTLFTALRRRLRVRLPGE